MSSVFRLDRMRSDEVLPTIANIDHNNRWAEVDTDKLSGWMKVGEVQNRCYAFHD